MPKSRLNKRRKTPKVIKRRLPPLEPGFDALAFWQEKATQHRLEVDIIADTDDGIAAQNDVDDELCDIDE